MPIGKFLRIVTGNILEKFGWKRIISVGGTGL